MPGPNSGLFNFFFFCSDRSSPHARGAPPRQISYSSAGIPASRSVTKTLSAVVLAAFRWSRVAEAVFVFFFFMDRSTVRRRCVRESNGLRDDVKYAREEKKNKRTLRPTWDFRVKDSDATADVTGGSQPSSEIITCEFVPSSSLTRQRVRKRPQCYRTSACKPRRA